MVLGGKSSTFPFCNCCAFYLFAFCCYAVLLMFVVVVRTVVIVSCHCLCLLFAGLSPFLPLSAGYAPRFRRDLLCLFSFYIFCAWRAIRTKAGNVESEAQRTRMSRSNPLTHFPVRHSLKVKIYCILLLFFY